MVHPALLLALLVGASAAVAQQTCYFPSGTQTNSNTVPCNSTTSGFTYCCNAGDVCISNAFCFGSALGMVYRGGCTDPTFSSPECPQSCTDYQTDDFANIWKCPAPYDQDLFSCGANSSTLCGKNDPETFSWPNGREMSISGQSGNATCISPSSAAASASAAAASASSAANGACEAIATAAAGAAGGVTAQAVAQARNGLVSWVVPLGVGLGVGLPFAAATIIFAVLYWRERKLRKQERETVMTTVNAVATEAVAVARKDFTRDSGKLLGGNEVYEMQDTNVHEMYTRPGASDPKSPTGTDLSDPEPTQSPTRPSFEHTSTFGRTPTFDETPISPPSGR